MKVYKAMNDPQPKVGIGIMILFLFLANVKKYQGKHYVHIGLIADWKSGVPRILEPEKSENWGWYGLDNLPKPLFEMCKLSFKSYKTKQSYFDF